MGYAAGPPRRGPLERRGDPVPRRARRRRRPASPTAPSPIAEARLMTARCGGITSRHRATCPTGARSTPTTTSTSWRWLDRLHAHLDAVAAPDAPMIVAGDFNIAPDRRRRLRPGEVRRRHPRQPARAGAAADAARPGPHRRVPPRPPGRRPGVLVVGLPRAATSTRAAACASTSSSARPAVAERAEWCVIDRNARKGKLPSDHAPVIVDLAD